MISVFGIVGESIDIVVTSRERILIMDFTIHE